MNKMVRMTRKLRQETLDQFLADTGHNQLRGREFLDWLRPQVDHPAWNILFHGTLEEKALATELARFRQFTSGLRITVRTEELANVSHRFRYAEGQVESFPMWLSPVDDRHDGQGGGYVPMDATDPLFQAELARQAATALKSWAERYGSVLRISGGDLDVVQAQIGWLESFVAEVKAGDEDIDPLD